ncbi:hypothetical protein PN456_19910 [Nodularia spumigena CS-586/05]|nr:hypothetical protein [Nodularia spumigena]MDB9342442.1 hypothetical protein [Nodularia spumigena CS-588/06]MDB9371180.1 hypothetical protein [Nodularia spumigena CS-586/05]
MLNFSISNNLDKNGISTAGHKILVEKTSLQRLGRSPINIFGVAE